MAGDDVKIATDEDKLDAFADLGEGARVFYEGVMRDNPSPRVRAAVEEVLVEAAQQRRATRVGRSGSRKGGRIARRAH